MDPTAEAVMLMRKLVAPKDVFFYAEVSEITGDTCSVKIGDLELTDVRMKATDDGSEDKLVVTPTKGSKVVVGSNGGDFRDLFVIKVDDPQMILYKHKDITIEIDGESGNITINGGDNKGLVKVEDLVNRLNTIEDDINDLKTIFSTWVVAPQDGGGALKSAAAQWYASQLQQTQLSDIENEKVKH